MPEFQKAFHCKASQPMVHETPAGSGDLTVNLGSINGYVAATANLLGLAHGD